LSKIVSNIYYFITPLHIYTDEDLKLETPISVAFHYKYSSV